MEKGFEGSLPKNRWDWFRWILITAYCVEIWVGILLFQNLKETHRLYSFISTATEQDNPDADSLSCVSGEVLREIADEKKSNDPAFEKLLMKELGVPQPLYVYGIWSHYIGDGKHAGLVRDREIKFAYKFRIKNRIRQFQPDWESPTVFSFHNRTFNRESIFTQLAPRAEIFDLEYFCPQKLWMVGRIGPKENGISFVKGTPEIPLVVSEIPHDDLLSWLFYSLLATALALSYLLITFFTRLQPLMKSNFEENPRDYFIFDVTKGPEQFAAGFLILYAAGAIWVLNYPVFTHSFHVDLLKALLAFGFFLLVHATKGVEFFYLADRKENGLFEVSRGFLSEYKIRRENLSEISPFIEIIPGLRSSIKYQLKTKNLNGVIDLSDYYTFRGPLEETLKEFREWSSPRPVQAG